MKVKGKPVTTAGEPTMGSTRVSEQHPIIWEVPTRTATYDKTKQKRLLIRDR